MNTFTDILDDPVDSDEPEIEWDENELDPRLARLSFSSTKLFHGCPRKYQLIKMSAEPKQELDWKSKLTFSFGTLVGDAVQKLLCGESLQTVLFNLFLSWEGHIYQENDTQRKSIFHAIHAIQILQDRRDLEGFLSEYEVVEYEGKPATELGIKIDFPYNCTYRGYIDIILRNINTGMLCIVDAKTDSGYIQNPDKYRNSEQSIGYSVALDYVEPEYSSYMVYYLVYYTRKEEWVLYEFPKNRLDRVLWLRDRIWDAQQLHLLAAQEGNNGIWPINSSHCVSYGRSCEFIGVCNMPTKRLTKPLVAKDLHEDESNYTFKVSYEDMI